MLGKYSKDSNTNSNTCQVLKGSKKIILRGGKLYIARIFLMLMANWERGN